MTTWEAGFGAVPVTGGTRFRVWAPLARSLDVVIERPDRSPLVTPLHPLGSGVFEGIAPGVRAGARYRCSIDGQGPFPDPASRFQPEGVHGPSEIVDPSAFAWTDHGWGGVSLDRLVLYELHIGTFTAEGTYSAASNHLPDLADLGITAIELMPLADFPGDRNWGYDGAALFAPARRYGRPDDLRRFLDAAHGLGIAVHVDVVYNHLGPDGAYAAAFSPRFLTDRYRTPWGDGVDLDGEHAHHVREFFIENALHWVHEYHADGLRIDATHAMADESPTHFVAELATRVRRSVRGREVHVIAEDARNLAHIVQPTEAGGWGLDAVWSDDFHHQIHVGLSGDRDGYFTDFSGSTSDIAEAVRRGWTFVGQHAPHWGHARGTDPVGIPAKRFVFFIQNHDQIGNRAFGGRLHHDVDPAAVRSVTALLLLAPQTPLVFMGQEWAAGTPFRFFTDHGSELAALVTAGRRQEFATFDAFSDPASRDLIPDPQAVETFLASRLDWTEREREPHASALRLHTALLTLRRETSKRLGPTASHDAHAIDDDTVVLVRSGHEDPRLTVVSRIRGSGEIDVDLPGADWRLVMTTEHPEYAPEGAAPEVRHTENGVHIMFHGPAAVIFERRGT